MLEYVEYKWHLNGVPNFFLPSTSFASRAYEGKVEKFTLWMSLGFQQTKKEEKSASLPLAPWENKLESDKKSTDADDVDKSGWIDG